MSKFVFSLLLLMCVFDCNGQDETDSTTTHSDSLYFQHVQVQLIGCWRTKRYQFKFQNNRGGEYKSRVRSSAPLFNLILKDEEVYLQWIELTGGEHLQKVISISERKLIVENESKQRVVYKRNKNCSSLMKGVK